jgi:hypothetical protein
LGLLPLLLLSLMCLLQLLQQAKHPPLAPPM